MPNWGITIEEKNLNPSKRKAYLMTLRDFFAKKNPNANGFELWWDIATASQEDRIAVINLVSESKEDQLTDLFWAEDGLNFNTGRG